MLQARWAGRGRRVFAAGLVAAVCVAPAAGHSGAGPGASGLTYAGLARQALATLEHQYYNGAGEWHQCVPVVCGATNRDWGADSLTYALYFHFQVTHDPGVRPIMNALIRTTATAPYVLSDVPMWDTIAAARDYQVTGNEAALAKAKTTFSYVAVSGLPKFARGACPRIYYQSPDGEGTSSRPSKRVRTTSRQRSCCTRSPAIARTCGTRRRNTPRTGSTSSAPRSRCTRSTSSTAGRTASSCRPGTSDR